MDKRIIYLDHAATTGVRPEVFEAMKPYFTEKYGNPSSIYSIGRENKKDIDEARKTVADCLGADKREIFFTGSGSEADNWAIKGVAYAKRDKGKHIISSSIEHHAVLHTLEFLEKKALRLHTCL